MKLILTDRHLDLPQLQDDVRMVNIAEAKIANCVGCFGCWTKTPGKCVIRDDAVNVYPLIAKSDEVVYVSKVKFGGYDTPMKTMLERAIPVQQAFIRLVNGETHHVQRAVVPKRATIVGYGALSDREKDLFCKLVDRNAHNMSFEQHRVLFAEEDEIDRIAREVVSPWRKP
ncbi:MAG: hypothetical protein U0L71_04155 [Eggerthellaceae bacterium]|nr:hypothetical protein [Eggerthellaceae bacterium]